MFFAKALSFPSGLHAFACGLSLNVGLSGGPVRAAPLSFVPKLVAAVVVFAVAGPWMVTTLVDYLRRTLETMA